MNYKTMPTHTDQKHNELTLITPHSKRTYQPPRLTCILSDKTGGKISFTPVEGANVPAGSYNNAGAS